MDEINNAVLKAFGMSAKRIDKDRYYYICRTETGPKALRIYENSVTHLIFAHNIKEELYNQGFNVDRFYLTIDGRPFVEIGDRLYVLTDVYEYKNAGFAVPEEIKLVVAETARMHRAIKRMQPERFLDMPADSKYEWPIPIGNDHFCVISKAISDLNAIKKRIGNQGRLSDFDVVFIKSYHHYLQLLKTSAARLERTDYLRKYAVACRDLTLCHNAIKEENVKLNGQDVYITDFGTVLADLQLNDLCSIIRRYFKNSNGSVCDIYQILDVYNDRNPITSDDVKILQVLLMYPHYFMKIAMSFYSKKRSFLPGALIARFESVVNDRHIYETYIEEMI